MFRVHALLAAAAIAVGVVCRVRSSGANFKLVSCLGPCDDRGAMSEGVVRTGKAPIGSSASSVRTGVEPAGAEVVIVGTDTKSDILINVDGATITGDGARKSPLIASPAGLLPVLATVSPPANGTVDLVAGKVLPIKSTNAYSVQFPAAASVLNGTPLVFVVIGAGALGVTISFVVTGSDVLVSFSAPGGLSTGVQSGSSFSFVSDGAGTWYEIL